MAPPDPGPLPPLDFAARDLPFDPIAAGTKLLRIHQSRLDPLFFGKDGHNRFDDPARAYGVCYLALTLEGAFAETCLRAVGARFVALSFLAARSYSEIEVAVPLRLVPVHGPDLAQLGATSAVTGGPHPIAQRWSCAIHDHPSRPDGIAYRSNHDNSEVCVSLFERAAASLARAAQHPFLDDRARLAKLLAHYQVGLG